MNAQLPGRPEPSSATPTRLWALQGLPAGIWALGLVSMFMDISSELIHSVLPVFMASTLGASMATIGVVEGVAESAAAITKVFSGAISDYLGKRKLLAVLGYGLAAFTKPIFPLATTMGWVFAARFIDRIGKGIRGAPRDALVADLAPGKRRGAAYGLRQSLDSVGAFLGPLTAVAFLVGLSNDLRMVLWIAVVPAFVAVALLVFSVHDPKRGNSQFDTPHCGIFAGGTRLPVRYWAIVGLGGVFTLARFSEAFLVLRAQGVGLPLTYVPLVLIVMNVIYTVTAYPAGIAADRLSPRMLLVTGLVALIAADVVLAAAASPLQSLIGAALWGLHMGLTQGLFAKLVADASSPVLRGTAFGLFNFVGGCALLLASLVAGALWSAFGPSATFLAGAGFAMVALLGLLAYRRMPQSVQNEPRPGNGRE